MRERSGTVCGATTGAYEHCWRVMALIRVSCGLGNTAGIAGGADVTDWPVCQNGLSVAGADARALWCSLWIENRFIRTLLACDVVGPSILGGLEIRLGWLVEPLSQTDWFANTAYWRPASM